ncbi:hypothetical protein [Limnothrix sp. FACHB-881]|nr:hypothetical protein [Limnothrix sp. FACHB-881]
MRQAPQQRSPHIPNSHPGIPDLNSSTCLFYDNVPIHKSLE